MKKFALALSLCLGLAATSHSQRLVFIYGHGQYNIPASGPIKDVYNYGLGAQGGVGVGLGGNFFVGTLAYQNFPKQDGVGGSSLTGVKGGYRRTFALKKLFMQFNAGYGNYSPAAGSNTGVFLADAAVGAKLLGLELTAAYETFTRNQLNGMFALKAGFNIGL